MDINMKNINLTINGTAVNGKAGQTILEVARDNNVFIPTLCNDERVKPFGSCLLCRVEVEGARGNMLACATPIAEGMVIRTESEGIAKSRKMCLELLVSQHYGDCKAPCSMTCPAEIDVQGYIAHIANGQYSEAIKLIKERNPLPLVCGRVCTRPCEDECRRNLVDERVGIDYLKRFVSDYDLCSENPYSPDRAPKTGKKAAVIGAGPAGLSCAYYLAKEGHDVTIFEKWPMAGGMLRFGIPEYRLPREPLEKEIKLIEKLGVKIQYNTTFGKDVTYLGLKEEGYGALFLGVGSQVGQSLGIDNENLDGVMSGVDFLGKVNLNSDIDFSGKTVIVIGGGNTAVDAARTSIRLNAKEVVLAYRRTKAEMPAHEMEIEEAEYEGVRLELLAAPKAIIGDGIKASGVSFVRMMLKEPDASGRRKPVEVPNSEFIIDAEVVIAAIGQTQDLSFLSSDFSIETIKNKILVEEGVMTTSLEGVFAGGDAVTGPDAAISAIAAGRRAAYSINSYLKGEMLNKPGVIYNHIKGKLKDINPEEYKDIKRVPKEKMKMLTREERLGNFKEVELGYTKEQASREAMRCLSCGCSDVNECKLRDYSTTFNINQNRLKGQMEHHLVDESHEFISRDPNKCIMCGLCVRICYEQQGAGALGFNDRGYSTVITPSFNKPLGEDNRCEVCGQCVSACPVGALTEKNNLPKSGPFIEVLTDTTCFGCGTGCSIVQHTAGELLTRTTARIELGVNNGNLCKKGRFSGYKEAIKNNLQNPYIRKNGAFEEVSFEEAFKYVGKKLREIQAIHGNNSTGIYVSPYMTNEELEASKKLSLDIIKTDNFGCLNFSEGLRVLEKEIGLRSLNATYGDIERSDCIICAGFDLKEANPVAALFVNKAALDGTKLIIIDTKESKLNKYASNSYVCSPEEIIKLLKDSSSSIFKECKDAKSPLLIIGDDITEGIAGAAAEFLKSWEACRNKVLLMHKSPNMRGIIDHIGIQGASSINEVRSIILIGDKNIGDTVNQNNTDFKVLCKPQLDLSSDDADVLIPLSGYLQVEGTYTNSGGSKGFVRRTINQTLGLDNVEIIEGIMEEIKAELNYCK